MKRLFFLLLVFFLFPFVARAGLDQGKLLKIDAAIQTAVNQGKIPGGFFRLESKGEKHQQVFGSRAKVPKTEAMTEDTIFDLASLSKVLSTAPSIVLLAERGKLDLDAKVYTILPEFLEGGVHDSPKDKTVTAAHRKDITVKHLLTHRSGLPAGISIRTENWWGHDTGVGKAIRAGLIEKPDSRFRYSDTNYIVLGEIIRRISGQRLDEFAAENLFIPLKMEDTGYRPDFTPDSRVAPTTTIGAYGSIRGEVHDPVARRMQGVAGHAGVFSTMEDVSRFVKMLLNGGILDGTRVFKKETVDLMLSNHMPDKLNMKRGLGWDISSPFAYQRGERFPREGFGHTGWTGTSIWADPASKSFLIFLSNRNHPTEAGRIKTFESNWELWRAKRLGIPKKCRLHNLKQTMMISLKWPPIPRQVEFTMESTRWCSPISRRCAD